MKRIIKLSLFIVMLVGVFTFTGCGKKEALTAETFKTTAAEKGYEVTDITEYITSEDITSAQIALKTNAYQIEFYVAKDEKGAKAGYEQYIANLEAVAGTSGTKGKETTSKTGAKYIDENGDYYSVVSRLDNTYLYVRAAKTYSAEIAKVVSELGY